MITGDFNMKSTKGDSLTSSDVYEQEILDEVESLNFTQIVDFFSTKRNTLDIVFVNNRYYVDAARVHREFMNSCVKSIHVPIIFRVCLPSTRHDCQSSSISSTKYSSTICDYDKLNALTIEQSFMPKCYSNSDQTAKEWYAGFFEKLDSTTPRRTQHRRNLPPWITPDTSNLLNRLSTEKV